MNKKVDFDKQHITSLAEVGNPKALKILRMAIDGDVHLMYFLNKETYRILGCKDADDLLASFPNPIEIYPNGKPIYFTSDSFASSCIPEFTKTLSPNNVYFLDMKKKNLLQKKFSQDIYNKNHKNRNSDEQLDNSKVIKTHGEILKKKKKSPLVRAKLEIFVEHLISATEYDTFSKFEDIMTTHYFYSKGAKPEDNETYDDHTEVKRVFCTQSKKTDATKNISYRVHFSFRNAAGGNTSSKSRALSSFKNIFDAVLARL